VALTVSPEDHAAECATMIVLGEWSWEAAAAVFFGRLGGRTVQDAEQAAEMLGAAHDEAVRARGLFFVEAELMLRRGIRAKATSREIWLALARLARHRAGTGMPLGYGFVSAEEITEIVRSVLTEVAVGGRGEDGSPSSTSTTAGRRTDRRGDALGPDRR
jgi:hypothetical protein